MISDRGAPFFGPFFFFLWVPSVPFDEFPWSDKIRHMGATSFLFKV